MRGLITVLAAVLATATVATPAAAAPGRTEVAVASTASDAHVVRESYVSLHAPLPASVGPRPAACDRVGYLRFRHVRGPGDFRRADAILVGMPGLQGGATLMDRIARNTIRRAAAAGRHIEFWSLDRRANCLEDHRGMRAAIAQKDPSLAVDYYFHGTKVNGHRFAGPPDAAARSMLSHFGLAQTMRDMMTVIAQVPAADRGRKVLCGGHSLGSRLTGSFANWDFDGNPATTRDAGYRQCAAYFSIDQRLHEETSLEPLLRNVPVGLGPASGATGQAAPYLEATWDSLLTLNLGALGAYVAPNARSTLAGRLPRDGTVAVLQRVLFSPDAFAFLTDTRQLRDFRMTNAALLGALYDDNAQPLGLLRISMGAFTGGPVDRKDFPTLTGLPNAGGIVGGNALVAAARTEYEGGPLYRWSAHNAIGTPRDSQGRKYTSRASEVTDFRDAARIHVEAPADFWEWYFPTRVLTEAVAESAGDRSGDLRNSMHDGVAKHPTLYLDSGEGIEGDNSTPSGPPGTRRLVLAGYNHIDPSTASYTQPGGRPEQGSVALARFVGRVT